MFRNGMPAASVDGPWVKSRKSIADNECVELTALADGQIALRNSRDPHGPALVFTKNELDAFLDGAKKNEFDHMIA